VIDLVNRPAPMRRMKFVIMTRNIVRAVERGINTKRIRKQKPKRGERERKKKNETKEGRKKMKHPLLRLASAYINTPHTSPHQPNNGNYEDRSGRLARGDAVYVYHSFHACHTCI
jgi:nitrate reductase cytochrome c-type subunit